MSAVKRAKEAHDALIEDIEALVAKAPERDDDLNEAVDKQAYAVAFAAWRDGKLSGTAEDIFDAVQAYLDPLRKAE